MRKEDIVRYYDQCEKDYRLLWDLDHSHAMHAGYWDHKTKTLRDALRRENEVLADLVGIKSSDRVLDAGCGVGGSSIFLAKHYECEVIGITLSHKQAQTAQSKAQSAGVIPKASFYVMDYTSTTFPDHYFDVVWGIESVCHAPNKELFIKEASRLLKPGGRLVVADGFTAGTDQAPNDRDLMQRWLKGWGVASLETVGDFERYLQNHSFKNICYHEVSDHIMPSSQRLYRYAWPAIVLSKMGEWIGLRTASQTDNLRSALCQYQALKKGLWQYGIFYAEKIQTPI